MVLGLASIWPTDIGISHKGDTLAENARPISDANDRAAGVESASSEPVRESMARRRRSEWLPILAVVAGCALSAVAVALRTVAL